MNGRSGGKGAAATAVSRCVGILKNETLAHQRFFVLERRALQIQKALGVYELARAMLFKNFIAVASLSI